MRDSPELLVLTSSTPEPMAVPVQSRSVGAGAAQLAGAAQTSGCGLVTDSAGSCMPSISFDDCRFDNGGKCRLFFLHCFSQFLGATQRRLKTEGREMCHRLGIGQRDTDLTV